jgi:hypothetical protein
MASSISTSFKSQLFSGTHLLSTGSGDTFKIALFTSAVPSAGATTAYSTTGEVSGTGYTAGGATLTIPASIPATSGTTAWIDFNDTSWTSATFSGVLWGLIYNATAAKGSAAIAVIDFGGAQSVTNGTFTIQWPTPDASNAIIRIS